MRLEITKEVDKLCGKYVLVTSTHNRKLTGMWCGKYDGNTLINCIIFVSPWEQSMKTQNSFFDVRYAMRLKDVYIYEVNEKIYNLIGRNNDASHIKALCKFIDCKNLFL